MTISKPTSTNLIEAANCAEVTAILIRAGYRVYRPEADVSGEDLIIRIPEGELRSVQMKGRPLVHWKLYGGKRHGGNDMWMLFLTRLARYPGDLGFSLNTMSYSIGISSAMEQCPAGCSGTRQARRSGPKKVWASSYASFYNRSSFPPPPRLIKGKFRDEIGMP